MTTTKKELEELKNKLLKIEKDLIQIKNEVSETIDKIEKAKWTMNE